MKKLSPLIILLILLVSCADEPHPVAVPNISLTHPVVFNVAAVNFVDSTTIARADAAQTFDEFKPTILDILRQWTHDKVSVNGNDGDVLINVKEASVVQQPLSIEGGMTAVFKRQQASKLLAHVAVDIVVRKQNKIGVASAQATHWLSLPENATGVEKQTAYYKLLNDLMSDLGKNLDQSMHEHLALVMSDSPHRAQ